MHQARTRLLPLLTHKRYVSTYDTFKFWNWRRNTTKKQEAKKAQGEEQQRIAAANTEHKDDARIQTGNRASAIQGKKQIVKTTKEPERNPDGTKKISRRQANLKKLANRLANRRRELKNRKEAKKRHVPKINPDFDIQRFCDIIYKQHCLLRNISAKSTSDTIPIDEADPTSLRIPYVSFKGNDQLRFQAFTAFIKLTKRDLTNAEVANTDTLEDLIKLYKSPYKTAEQKPETIRQKLHKMYLPPNMYFEPFMGKIGRETPIAQKWADRYFRKAKIAQRVETRKKQQI